ncbi:MAG: S41 family peptidase [Magnetovibrio sp.]|nr:S41 family peptidase [Magnetovibrio sp.]
MNRVTQLTAFVFGGALAFGLLQTLSACSEGRVAIDQVVRVFGSMSSLDPASEKQLERVYVAFDTYTNNPNNLRQRNHFRDAFSHVRANYVVETDGAALIDAALKGIEEQNYRPGSVEPREFVETGLDAMMASLDPHSSYLNPEELRESRVMTSGEFGGLGIEVTMEKGAIKIVSPIEGTPAYRAGLQAGDRIVKLDGDPVGDMTLSDAVKLMRGRPGDPIVLTIERKRVADFDVRVVRAIIEIRSVRWHMEGNIAYVRVASFTEKVFSKLENAFDEIEAKGGSQLQGVVLDLRNNPGGLLDQSLYVSDSFLDKGVIVSVRERNSEDNRTFKAHQGDLADGVPIVVLINEGSASASEIVASALKDHRRAVVMGRRSFGKGSVQTIQPLPLEGALKLTTARYYAPAGYTIQAQGVSPDIVLNRPVEMEEQHDKDDEGAPIVRRESDLPGALNADSKEERPALASIDREECPKAGKEGKDFELGCALAYLQAGSVGAFLSSIGTKVSVQSLK